jgi:ADP-ribose pyrophosphatase YjhB (NUDIX family)
MSPKGSEHMDGNRARILSQIRGIVGDRLEDGRLHERMNFCIADGARLGPDARRPAGFVHADHLNPRAFVFDPVTRFEFRADGELVHHAAGAVLWHDEAGERRYCLLRRRAHPVGFYTIPAGHVEQGEAPATTMRREVYEETGLAVLSAEPLYEGEMLDECRRGADYHIWYAYMCECIGEPRLSDEADIVGWYTRAEIINDLPLTRPTAELLAQHWGERPRRARER